MIEYLVDRLCTSKYIQLADSNLDEVPPLLLERLQSLDASKNYREKKILDLSRNKLQIIPIELTNLSILSNVKIDGNPLTLVPESCRNSWQKLLAYYKNLDKRAESWGQCKVCYYNIIMLYFLFNILLIFFFFFNF